MSNATATGRRRIGSALIATIRTLPLYLRARLLVLLVPCGKERLQVFAAVGFLGLLYAAWCYLWMDRCADFLHEHFDRFVGLFGRQGGIVALALVHTVVPLLVLPAVVNQMVRSLTQSDVLRLFYHVLRDREVQGGLLIADSIFAVLTFEILLAPFLWRPLFSILGTGELVRLIVLKVALFGAVLAAASVCTALWLWLEARHHPVAALWVAATVYWGAIIWFSFEANAFVAAPSPKHPFAIAMGALFRLLDGRHDLDLSIVCLETWGVCYFIGGGAVARGLRRYGINYV